MKSIRSFSNFVFLLISVLFFTACEPEVQNKSLPVLTTTEVSSITQSSAVSGGNIISDGGFSVTARGVCWSTKPLPTTEDNKTVDGVCIGEFESEITGLTVDTKYYVRAYATTSAGTAYGESLQFTTKASAPSTVTDIDGNVYHTVTIGSQTWLVENLKTTKFNDGTNIPNVTEKIAWAGLTTSAYCWYNNEISNKGTYGALYNWYVVNTGKLAPSGWHVANPGDWGKLENYVKTNLGASLSVAKALAATTSWDASIRAETVGMDMYLNNSSGFSAFPGGIRNYDGTFQYKGYYGSWWECNSTQNALLSSDYTGLSGFGSDIKQYGFSVRCVWD